MENNHSIILEAHNIHKKYGRKVILKGIDLKILRGNIVGLLGPNGAGKTTLFYILVGLEKATEGSIFFNGEAIGDLPIHKRAQLGLNYLPQDSSIFRKLSVENNIKAILDLQKNMSIDNKEKKLEELLDLLSIKHVRKEMGYVLSGGERRRVEIARSLASQPRVLLLDEPFTGIDPITIQEIQAIIKNLVKNLDITIIIIEHNVRETLLIVDYAYLVKEGEIYYEGNSDEFFSNELVKKVYLGDEFQRF